MPPCPQRRRLHTCAKNRVNLPKRLQKSEGSIDKKDLNIRIMK
jgi:hypothetical protein